jgi:hypothetical protein
MGVPNGPSKNHLFPRHFKRDRFALEVLSCSRMILKEETHVPGIFFIATKADEIDIDPRVFRGPFLVMVLILLVAWLAVRAFERRG